MHDVTRIYLNPDESVNEEENIFSSGSSNNDLVELTASQVMDVINNPNEFINNDDINTLVNIPQTIDTTNEVQENDINPFSINVTKEQVINLLQELGILVPDTGYLSMNLENKLCKTIGCYGLTHEHLDISFNGMTQSLYRKCKHAFDLGRHIAAHGTNVHPNMIFWGDGIMQTTTN